MRLAVTLLAGLAAGTALAGEEPAALSCRAQVVYDCARACADTPVPVELTLDFAAGRGTFCRAVRCDDGTLESIDAKGQLDEASYRMFRLDFAAAGEEPVTGIVQGGTFHAESKGLGAMAGTCKKAGG